MTTIHGTKNKLETYGLIALAWDHADIGDDIIIIQPNDLGGKSLQKTIENQFDSVGCESKNHARYITITKTESKHTLIDEWLGHTKLRLIEGTGFYSMPGLFGWDKIDIGSQLLLDHLPPLKGHGADFGCGYGYLSKNILIQNEGIQSIYCFDYDIRAIEACMKNIDDPRAIIKQADCTHTISNVPTLDFIVMNPPFHGADGEDRTMGQHFIINAAHHLNSHGELWMVANKHLPYEKTLAEHFKSHEKIAEEKGFKVFKAVK
jgi:16S rRNA (guanine1207-N2)-methyltransferase